LITQSALPPAELTSAQHDALNAAHEPSAANPLATLADLSLLGIRTRLVAAGQIDLRGGASKVVGGLHVVDHQEAGGLATLSFTSYRFNQSENYVVKALPISGQPATDLRTFSLLQLVAFQPSGFVLQMAQPLAGTTNLGPCMVEVSEIIASEVTLPTLEEAIRLYYSLIQQEQYEEAYPMLSDLFRVKLNIRTLARYQQEWQRSGPATILTLSPVQATPNRATVVLDLEYSKAVPSQRQKRIRYEFARNEKTGIARFGYWLFLSGEFLD
jgi:hypothetical protein